MKLHDTDGDDGAVADVDDGDGDGDEARES